MNPYIETTIVLMKCRPPTPWGGKGRVAMAKIESR